jgi:hypothetical protein
MDLTLGLEDKSMYLRGKLSGARHKVAILAVAAFVLCAPFVITSRALAGGVSGAVYTTTADGTVVNANIYPLSTDVFIGGGPQNQKASGLPAGTYYFQVTDPSGADLLSTDNAVCRELLVAGGRVSGSTGPTCKHANGTFNPANGSLPVQLAPFSNTPNKGNEYKVWVVPTGSATISTGNPNVLVFSKSDAKTDNFKTNSTPPLAPEGSCEGSGSLSALVNGTSVTSYVPKANWASNATGIDVVNVEGASVTNTLVPTTSPVNSCASNSITGQTVCTGNNTDVYVLKGAALDPTVSPNPLTSGGTGGICFSGGCATNTGVSMDATDNKALIALSVGGRGGFQFLDLATNTFEPAFASSDPSSKISEDPLIDPVHHLILSASEDNNYEIVNVSSSTAPQFYEHPVSAVSGELDSSAEDCSTGVILAPSEFTGPSQVEIADISNPGVAPEAVFTPGTPGSWTAPEQVQTLTGSFLSAGASGSAVAQGTHTGVISGEFGGDALTALALPATSGGGTVPAISNWVTCGIGSGFSNGDDPHTLAAYQSPNGGDAIALLANGSATEIARVDLTAMLNPTTVPVSGNVCTGSTLPASVVSLIPLP